MYTLLSHSRTIFMGKETRCYEHATSTNEIASILLSNFRPAEGTAILTFDQTAGKGQRGNTWLSEAGKNIAVSYILYPLFISAAKQFLLAQAIALGVCDFIRQYIDSNEVRIKWPNDIYVGSKKIAGILIENTISNAGIKNSIIGIGINVNQTNFDNKLLNPTSFTKETGKEFNLPGLAENLSACLEPRILALKAQKTALIETDYLNNLYKYQQSATYLDSDGIPFEGTIIGIAPGGKLIVQIKDKNCLFDLKEISFC